MNRTNRLNVNGYITKHLFGSWYLVRNYPKENRKFSIFNLGIAEIRLTCYNRFIER